MVWCCLRRGAAAERFGDQLVVLSVRRLSGGRGSNKHAIGRIATKTGGPPHCAWATFRHASCPSKRPDAEMDPRPPALEPRRAGGASPCARYAPRTRADAWTSYARAIAAPPATLHCSTIIPEQRVHVLGRRDEFCQIRATSGHNRNALASTSIKFGLTSTKLGPNLATHAQIGPETAKVGPVCCQRVA